MNEETKTKIGMIVGLSLIVLGQILQILSIVFAWLWA